MAILPALEEILQHDELDAEDSASSKDVEIESLIPTFGWNDVLSSLLELLAEDRRQRDYEVAAQVIWSAVLEGLELPIDRVIALLYFRFDPNGDSEDNLVWSITSKLKRISYWSKYQPLQDPGVRAEIEQLKRRLK